MAIEIWQRQEKVVVARYVSACPTPGKPWRVSGAGKRVPTDLPLPWFGEDDFQKDFVLEQLGECRTDIDLVARRSCYRVEVTKESADRWALRRYTAGGGEYGPTVYIAGTPSSSQDGFMLIGDMEGEFEPVPADSCFEQWRKETDGRYL